MATGISDVAPPMTETLVDWAEEHADEVRVAADEAAGTYEVTVGLERGQLLLSGEVGSDGTPGLWTTASLALRDGMDADAALGFPRQLPEPPIVVGDDGTLLVQTVNGEIELSPRGSDDAAGH